MPPSALDTLAESLAGHAAPDQWLHQHPDGTVLDLEDAYALGRRATRCCTT